MKKYAAKLSETKSLYYITLIFYGEYHERRVMQCWVYFFGVRQMAQLKQQFFGDSSQSLRTGFLSFGRLRKAYNTGSNEFCQEFADIDFPVAALHPVVELFIPLGWLHRRGREWSPLHDGIKRCRSIGAFFLFGRLRNNAYHTGSKKFQQEIVDIHCAVAAPMHPVLELAGMSMESCRFRFQLCLLGCSMRWIFACDPLPLVLLFRCGYSHQPRISVRRRIRFGWQLIRHWFIFILLEFNIFWKINLKFIIDGPGFWAKYMNKYMKYYFIHD